MIHFDLPKEQSSIIKVIGIGGGGSNAVNYMYSQGIEGVDFIICNTDSQALADSAIPNKIHLGPHLTQGLGAGANPEIGKQATEESFEEIKKILEVNTKMAFITAGMGGGTGTGGAPIIARICRDLGILTVGIVTTPFSYEGRRRMQQADKGIQNLKEYVDTLLVISNDKLRMQFGNLPFKAAFAKADNILATAAKCITDVINIHGVVNVDFADVCTAMRNGGVAILGSATADGENRSQKAIDSALSSPLLNDSEIKGAKWILLNITSAEGEHEHTIDEMDTIQAYVQQQAGDECDVILGMGHDDTLENKLGVTIIATGFAQKPIALQKDLQETKKKEEKIVMELGKEGEEKKMYDQNTLNFEKEEDAMAPKLVDPAGERQEEETTPEPISESEQKEPEKEVFELKAEPEQEPESKLEKEKPEEPKASEEQVRSEDPVPSAYSGGYLSRPSHIYAGTGDRQNKTAESSDLPKESKQNSSPSGMTLFYKEEQPQETRPKADTKNEEENSASPPEADPVNRPVTSPADSADKPETQPEHPVVKLEETEEQKQMAAARIARLRNLSFNMKNLENAQELESVPAYIRRNVALNDQQGSEEEPYSQYSVRKNEDGKQAEISTINTFLEGRKPD